jgi:hypothetical protein
MDVRATRRFSAEDSAIVRAGESDAAELGNV